MVRSDAHRTDRPGRVLGRNLATLVVFWPAHRYATALSHHLGGAARPRWAVITAAMAEGRPMLAFPLPLRVLLFLVVAGAVHGRFGMAVMPLEILLH